jgi:hypothetical protein
MGRRNGVHYIRRDNVFIHLKIENMKMPLLIAGGLLVSAVAIHHSQLCPFGKAKSGIVKQTKHVPAARATAAVNSSVAVNR